MATRRPGWGTVVAAMTAIGDNSAMMTATGGYIIMLPIIAVTVSLPITATLVTAIVADYQRSQPDRPAWAR